MRYKYYDVCRDGNGVILTGASISVTRTSDSSSVNLYDSKDSSTPVAISSSSDGSFAFFIDALENGSNDTYTINVSKSGYTTFTISNVLIDAVAYGVYVLSESKTITKPLSIPDGVIFNNPASYTMSFTSPFFAGGYQVFSGFTNSGSITFSGNATGTILPEWFGAKGDGATDCVIPFTVALGAGNNLVKADSRTYYFSSGINIPDTVALCGTSMIPGNPPSGTVFQFDEAVDNCITLTQGGGLGTVTLKECVVSRVGTPPASSSAVKIDGSYNVIMENVFAYNHARGFYYLSYGVSGLGSYMKFCYTGKITENHYFIDAWPELRVIGGRCGMNGAGDVNGNAFVYITATNTGGVGIGPNTIDFNDVQFNQGTAGPSYLIDMEDIVTNIGGQGFLKLLGCHCEGITDSYFKSVGTNNFMQRMLVSGCSFNQVLPMFGPWGSTHSFNEYRFEGNFIGCSTFAPPPDVCNGLSMVCNSFGGTAVTYNAPSTWSVASVGNTYVAGASLTISGSGWASGFFADIMNPGSTIANTGTPIKNITVVTPGQALTSWDPKLTFGGSSAGISYDAHNPPYTIGACHVVGNQVTYLFRVRLTSKGSATGIAEISGFPIIQNDDSYQTGGGGVVSQCSYLSGITGTIMANGPVGTGVIQLVYQSTAGTANLNDTNFTDTSEIAGNVVFFL